jgi:phage-related minor tail protein
LLKEYDEGSYNSMAGIMEKFGFAKGGFTGYGNSSDVAGFVHRKETVLNADHTASLAKLFDVPAHDVASIIPNLPSLMGGSSNPVINLSQQITISGTSQEIIDKVSKTIRYDTLNVIDEALRRVGGKL